MSGPAYRIGFLNPWEAGAEIQAVKSLSVAARRVGHELVRVRNSREIIAANLDFVLAIEPGQPKTTDVPTFCVVHSPRSILLESRSHLENITYLQSLLTFDGYLTIADTSFRFISSLCASADRPERIGFYYNTPQRQALTGSIAEIAARGALRLCYFGINWEPRARPLFRALAQRPYMRFYGPPQGWDYLNHINYYGDVPFDGQSVQRTYAMFGAGLVVLSLQHTLDDVISNRIFEISSVGAAVICPDLPWIRKNFGDTVFYYDRFAPPRAIVGQIDRLMEEICGQPAAAAQRAMAAKAIFDEKFAGEAMLRSAVRYFEEWRAAEGRPVAPAEGPTIDVIVRRNRRGAGDLATTLNAIDAQRAGRFRVILAGGEEADLAGLRETGWQRVECLEIAPAGERGASLAPALAMVRNELFAVLEEGNFWLSDHIASLLTLAAAAPGRAYAYSGTMRLEEPAPEPDPTAGEGAAPRENRHIGTLEPLTGGFEQITASLAVDTFLASAALLRFIDLDNWPGGSTETAILQAKLIGRAEPAFSHRPTACIVARAGRPVSPAAIVAGEDAFEALLRLQGEIARIERNVSPPAVSVWSRLHAAMQRIVEEQRQALVGDYGVLALEGSSVVVPLQARDDIERRQIAFARERIVFEGATRLEDNDGQPTVTIVPLNSPYAYGVQIRLDPAALFSGPQWVVLEFPPVSEMFGFGLLDNNEQFLTRMPVPVSSMPVEAWLHVPDPDQLRAIVVHNWISPLTAPLLLSRAWLVQETPPSDSAPAIAPVPEAAGSEESGPDRCDAASSRPDL